MKKKLLAALLCAALLLPLAGCGGRELYERLLIHGIGVDVEDGQFAVTVRSSISPEDEGEEFFRCRGRTVLEALSSLSRSTGRQPFYAHNYLVVFGRECAEQGLDRCLDFFIRYYNTRPAVRMYLAEEKAEDILRFQKDGSYLKMAELQQLGDSSRETGRTVRVEVLDFVNSVNRPGSSGVLPVLRAGEEGVEIVSTAYFDGYACRGTLSLEETRGFLAVKNLLEKGDAVVSGPFGDATLSLAGAESSLQIGRAGSGLPRFEITVDIRADVSSLSGSQSKPAEEGYAQLEQALARTLEKEIQAALDQAARRDRCDVFGFGTALFRSDPRWWNALAADWKRILPKCDVTLQVRAAVSRLVF